MNSSRIEEIEIIANTALRSAYPEGLVKPPVDLKKILDQYGLVLKSGKFKDNSISGAYVRESKTIFVSADETFSRASFTIAHELGHYLLHESKPDEIFYRKDADVIDGKKDPIETEANWFAASLLMPRDLIKRYWEISNSVSELADFFSVSYSAMFWRLKNLGLSPNASNTTVRS